MLSEKDFGLSRRDQPGRMTVSQRVGNRKGLALGEVAPSSGCIINSGARNYLSRHKMSERLRFQLKYLSNNLLDTVNPPFALSLTGRLSQKVKVKSKKSVYKLLDSTSCSTERHCFPSSAACCHCAASGMASCFDFPVALHSLLQAKLKINSVNVFSF